MAKYLITALLIFAASLAVSGCSITASNAGAGYERLTPSAATRNFIIINDDKFARQVVAHNEMCAKSPACRKN